MNRRILRPVAFSRRGLTGRFIAFLAAGALAGSSPSMAQSPEDQLDREIASAGIEELLNMTVTSVSKVPETLKQASAAVFVLTADDIRRSGARSIPDALRLVPGVQVARVSADRWAVSIRGFNARAANKLLVMIDGVTIYDPLFSGVLWETKDVLLEDVDRIEVIRGPGGSTWGANAVNGVISIITKHTKNTTGGLLVGGGGSEERGFTSLRYGAKVSDTTFIRTYGKYYNRDEGYRSDGNRDDSNQGQGGFRLDSEVDENHSFTLSGNVYDGSHDGPTQIDNLDGRGNNLLGRFEAHLSKTSHASAQIFYDRVTVDTPVFKEDRDTFEVDLQHQFRPLERVDFVYGVVYRATEDYIEPSDLVALIPDERFSSVVGVFGESQIDVIRDVVRTRVGTKIEHNDYTGLEVQPAVGVTWTVSDAHTLWSSVSQAVRTPSRLENDFQVFGPNNMAVFTGNRGLESETLTAYEIGYRFVPAEDLFFDVTTFFNSYDELVTVEGATFNNSVDGSTYGGEAAATWRPVGWAQLKAAYTYLDMDLDLDSGSFADPAIAVESVEGNNPHHQASLGSSFELGDRWEVDVVLRYVDALSVPSVSRYIVADAQVAWKATKNLELAVVGQNLFDRRHFEQGGPAASQVEEGVYGKVTLKF